MSQISSSSALSCDLLPLRITGKQGHHSDHCSLALPACLFVCAGQAQGGAFGNLENRTHWLSESPPEFENIFCVAWGNHCMKDVAIH